VPRLSKREKLSHTPNNCPVIEVRQAWVMTDIIGREGRTLEAKDITLSLKCAVAGGLSPGRRLHC